MSDSLRVKCYLVRCLYAPFLLVVSLFFNAVYAQEIDLVLAGGGLKTCSSLAQKNCSKKEFYDNDLTEILYQVTAQKINTLIKSASFKTLSIYDLENYNSIFVGMYAKLKGAEVTKQQLKNGFIAQSNSTLFRSMPDELYYAMHDHFEVRQTTLTGDRKREKTMLAFNENSHSVAIYKTFVEQTKLKANKKGKSEPTIIVVTASSRDPFESADFYTSVFGELTKNVIWLPIDGAVRIALEQKKSNKNACSLLPEYRAQLLSFDRERIYPNRTQQQKLYCENPELLLKEIQSADGIFFNGGDQSKTLAALVNVDGTESDELTLIKLQVEQHLLVVGGTSAGTAVHSGGEFNNAAIPMITNGDPELSIHRGAFGISAPSARCSESKECDAGTIKPGDLTFRENGGSGLFELGILDTHFSERDRESRLAVLAAQTNQRFAFGVDETTALLVSKEVLSEPSESKKNNKIAYTFGVIGQNGVFIIDRQNSPHNLENSSKTNINYVSGQSYFLNQGDTATLNDLADILAVTFASNSTKLSDSQKAKFVLKSKGTWRYQTAKFCGKTSLNKWKKWQTGFALQSSSNTQYVMTTNKQCSYSNLPFVITELD